MATGRKLITIGYDVPSAIARPATGSMAITARAVRRIIRNLSRRNPCASVHKQKLFGVDEGPLQVLKTFPRALALFEEASDVLAFVLRRIAGQRGEVNVLDGLFRTGLRGQELGDPPACSADFSRDDVAVERVQRLRKAFIGRPLAFANARADRLA